jgi:hypothetical protein
MGTAVALEVAGEPVFPRFDEREATRLWWVSTCIRCNQPTIWRGHQVVYPLASLGAPAHPDMPDDARELYVEAAQVAAVSRRAGAALARATVERLIKTLDPDAPNRANLDARITRIRPRVSSSLGDMLEVVRYLGNKMLHVEEPDKMGELVVLALDDVEGPLLVEMLLETANDLVDELIAKPNAVAGVRARLPQTLLAKLSGFAEVSGRADAETGQS